MTTLTRYRACGYDEDMEAHGDGAWTPFIAAAAEINRLEEAIASLSATLGATTTDHAIAVRAGANLAEALRRCLPLLRDELRFMFEAEAVWQPDEGTGIRADFHPLDAESAAHAAPIIAAIRTAEALVGRVPDDCPDWLNEVIDGTREWRA